MATAKQKTPKHPIRDDILLSLEHLRHTCPIKECEAVLQLSLDLCFSCIDFDRRSNAPANRSAHHIKSHGTVGALDFLRQQAKHHMLEEVEMILEATYNLCFVTHYLKHRRELNGFYKAPDGSRSLN